MEQSAGLLKDQRQQLTFGVGSIMRLAEVSNSSSNSS
jgi:hypothetical protein